MIYPHPLGYLYLGTRPVESSGIDNDTYVVELAVGYPDYLIHVGDEVEEVGNPVPATDNHVLTLLFQEQIQRHGAPEGVPVRIFVGQDYNRSLCLLQEINEGNTLSFHHKPPSCISLFPFPPQVYDLRAGVSHFFENLRTPSANLS